jgi:hypothetical protein
MDEGDKNVPKNGWKKPKMTTTTSRKLGIIIHHQCPLPPGC